MSRTIALGTLAVVLALPAASSAADQEQWVPREHRTTVRFSGDIRPDCKGTEDTQEIDVPRPARNVVVVDPHATAFLRDERGGLVRVTDRDIETQGDPFSWRVAITVRGGECHPEHPHPFRRWKTNGVNVLITYEHREFVNDPLNGPCADPYATIFDLQTVRTSCLYANDLVRRYLTTLNVRGAHRLGSWTCYDRVVSERGRVVVCRGPSQRFVKFIFRRSGAAQPRLAQLGPLGSLR